ncbi:hypothetical protein [Amycolatopsis sp. La24]|nr:hypothetical protein [Amycolatopsis sp. La24]
MPPRAAAGKDFRGGGEHLVAGGDPFPAAGRGDGGPEFDAFHPSGVVVV